MSLPFLAGVTTLLTTALGDRLDPGVTDYLDLFTDDAVLEVPYAPAGPLRLDGRDAIADAMEKLRGVVALEPMTLTGAVAQGDRTVLEYEGRVHVLKTDRRFEQRYIAVIGLREGRIALFREYANPLPQMEAFKP